MTTRRVGEPVMSRDRWGSAPVAVGRHHRRLGWVVVALLVAATAVFGLLLARTAPTTPPATPSTPAPTAAASSPRSLPFDVTVEVTDITSIDNDRLFGREAADTAGGVDIATSEIDGVLEGYLNAEFVATETRFSEQPLSGLLSPRALDAVSAGDLPGLGALGVSVRQVEAEPVTAKARMLTSGSDVVLVTVRYDARAQVVTDDGLTVPLHQRATMVFVPEDGDWRAEAVEAGLDLPVTPGGSR